MQAVNLILPVEEVDLKPFRSFPIPLMTQSKTKISLVPGIHSSLFPLLFAASRHFTRSSGILIILVVSFLTTFSSMKAWNQAPLNQVASLSTNPATPFLSIWGRIEDSQLHLGHSKQIFWPLRSGASLSSLRFPRNAA